MRLAFAPLLILGACAASGSAETHVTSESMITQDLSDLKIGEHIFKRRQLANGLHAVAVQDAQETATVFMALTAGTRDENADTTGLAHLTEHAMFAGTPTTGTDLHEKTIVDWGGESNAFTRDDYTMYYDHNFPPQHLSTVLQMEADRLRNLSLDEKPTLHERWRLEVEETHSYQPADGRAEELEAAVFKEHPYRFGLKDQKGNTKAIALPVSAIRDFYDRHYQPNRVAIVVVGPMDPNQALDAVEAAFGDLPRGQEAPQYVESDSASRVEIIESQLPRDRNLRVWLMPTAEKNERVALDVLGSMMSRADLPCGVPLSVSVGGRVDQDMFSLSWSCEESKLAQVELEVNALLNSFRNGDADYSELMEVKELLGSSYVDEPLRARPYFALAGTIAWNEAHGLSEFIEAYANAIEKIDQACLTSAASSWLSEANCISVVFAGTGAEVKPLPDDPQGLRSAASEAQETGDIERALAAYGLLLEKMPDKMNLVINYAERGMLFMEIKDFDSAIADFEAALVVIDYPAVRELLEEAHARKARAMRGEFEGEEAPPEAATEHREEYDLQAEVDSTMQELEEWRGLKFAYQVVPEFVDVADSPDEKLGGWYEPDTKRLVVVTGKEDSGANFTRGAQLHEIFHALQDQTWDLSQLDAGCSTTDEMRALQGVIEGEAMLAVADLMNYDFAQHSQIPAEGALSREKYEKLFNYGVGLSFVRSIRDHGGWEAVNQVWGKIPGTTHNLLHPESYGKPNPIAFDANGDVVELEIPAGEILESDVLGEFELRWLLIEDEKTRELADLLGETLVADRWCVVTPPDSDHQHEVWTLLFESDAWASLFAGASDAFERESWTVNLHGQQVILTKHLLE